MTEHSLSLSDDLGSIRVDCTRGWWTWPNLADLWVPDLLAIEAAHLADQETPQ